ncbi:DUF5719 family protein [Pengzhenrongella sicca]|uniref:Uncharacterized protein n=1 Tax=Pengzhenrongella sicca TaxID=2819238 RepID=A0A8A4ZIB3_9MICO|nr:DUF5719 family protein [Pengzhenrongella sicca]QTE30256.1 hypothetical protein J4E96_04410 [Pengzhenrongella sicca]
MTRRPPPAAGADASGAAAAGAEPSAAAAEPSAEAAAPAVLRAPGRLRGRLARFAGAIAVLAVTGAAAAAAVVVPPPADVPVTPVTVGVPAAASVVVCAGALAQPAGDGVGDSAFDPTPVDTVSELRAVSAASGDDDAAPAGTLAPLEGGEPLGTLRAGGSGAGALRLAGHVGPTVLRAEPVGDLPPHAAASSASITTAGDLRGLAAASCQVPAAEQWLVGGSTELSNSATLVVANPGATAAEVTIEVFGPSGAVELAGSAGFLVAPGAERALLLEGVAAEQRLIAVHVSAAGGQVTARVQDSRLNGFTPAGVDLVSAGAAPSTRQVVSGLVVPDSALDDADTAVLRLLAPAAGTTARISLLGPAGVVALPGADSVELVAGEVTDLSLGGLPAGPYTAVVDADEPVVAAAMITRTGISGEFDDVPPLERAWSAAAVPGLDATVALPAGVTGTVVLTGIGSGADGSGEGTATGVLRAIGADGGVLAERDVSVPAGTTTSLDVGSLFPGTVVAGLDLVLAPPAGASGDEEAGPELAWSVVGSVQAADGEFVSVLTPTPTAVVPDSVEVRGSHALGLP